MDSQQKLSFVSRWIISIRLTVLLLTFGALFPLIALKIRLFPPLGRHSVRWGYRLVLIGLDIRLRIIGRPVSGKALFVANHISYADIPILGALLHAQFVAKEGVREWPLIGWLAQAFGTLFVSRQARDTKKELAMLQDAALRCNLIFFPEGTSTEGSHVLPFKSTFFEVLNTLKAHETVIQPISLVYENLYGRPIGRFFRKFIGWRGDTEFLPHLRQMLSLGTHTVSVIFHDPLPVCAFPSRKELAQASYQKVREGVAARLSGKKPKAPQKTS